jgi:hypothetical protein
MKPPPFTYCDPESVDDHGAYDDHDARERSNGK